MKKVLIINGHPDKESFCNELALSYKRGSDKSSGYSKLINLRDLEFDPILQYGYRKKTELESDLLQVQQDILHAGHLVFVYPTWWGTYPALLKGFIDRVFLPEFAYKYRKNSFLRDKLLKGRSARLVVTMDAPHWYYSFINRSPGHHSLKKSILKFCGIRPVKITSLDLVSLSGDKKRRKWIRKIENFGQARR